MRTHLLVRVTTFTVAVVLAAGGAVGVTVRPAKAETVRDAIVATATNQLGGRACNPGYYNSCGIEWCAEFARWVWSHGGVADTAGLDAWAQSFKTYGQNRGTYHSRSSGYTPQSGDAIVFDWDHAADAHPIDHVAIVTSVTSSVVYTIGGNQGSSDDLQSTVSRASYSRSDGDIDGYVEPAGIDRRIGGVANVYGVLADGRLTFSTIDAASGTRLKTVLSETAIGFTPKAMATLNFNTILMTDTGGNLYRIDVITNRDSVGYNPPVRIDTGWTHELLTFDANTHLFGIRNGDLRRYTVSVAKPTAANISTGQLIGNGFYLNTLAATASNWLIGTTPAGALLSYKLDSAGGWQGHTLATDHWYFDAFLSPGNGVYYGKTAGDGLYRYLDSNPFDNTGTDIRGYSDPVDASGWTQVLLSAQPNTITKE